MAGTPSQFFFLMVVFRFISLCLFILGLNDIHDASLDHNDYNVVCGDEDNENETDNENENNKNSNLNLNFINRFMLV